MRKSKVLIQLEHEDHEKLSYSASPMLKSIEILADHEHSTKTSPNSGMLDHDTNPPSLDFIEDISTKTNRTNSDIDWSSYNYDNMNSLDHYRRPSQASPSLNLSHIQARGPYPSPSHIPKLHEIEHLSTFSNISYHHTDPIKSTGSHDISVLIPNSPRSQRAYSAPHPSPVQYNRDRAEAFDFNEVDILHSFRGYSLDSHDSTITTNSQDNQFTTNSSPNTYSYEKTILNRSFSHNDGVKRPPIDPFYPKDEIKSKYPQFEKLTIPTTPTTTAVPYTSLANGLGQRRGVFTSNDDLINRISKTTNPYNFHSPTHHFLPLLPTTNTTTHTHMYYNHNHEKSSLSSYYDEQTLPKISSESLRIKQSKQSSHMPLLPTSLNHITSELESSPVTKEDNSEKTKSNETF